MGSMEKSSEILIRSTLHDLANVLAGVRGILDLDPPGQPLAQRDRDRMGAVIEKASPPWTAAGTWPWTLSSPSRAGDREAWRTGLLEDLEPLGDPVPVPVRAGAGKPRSGGRLAGQAAARVRPGRDPAGGSLRQGGVLTIACAAGPEGWRLRWTPCPSSRRTSRPATWSDPWTSPPTGRCAPAGSWA